MTITKIKKLVNPRRTKNASAKRRKMSPKQIRHFGTTRQKAALKAARTRKRTATHRAAAPRPKRRMAAANPAQLLILGNPRPAVKRKVKTKSNRSNRTMAATKKQLAALRKARAARKRMTASNPRRTTSRRPNTHVHRVARRSAKRKSNSTKVYVIRRNGARRAGRRNPEMLGISMTTIAGGLVGVYATKAVTPTIAAMVPQVASSGIMAALVSAVVAWGGGTLISKFGPASAKQFAAGFMFGGFMQAGGQLWNTFASGSPLSGLGDFAPGGPVGLFPVMNPIRAAAMARAQGALPPPTGAPQNNLAGMDAARMFM